MTPLDGSYRDATLKLSVKIRNLAAQQASGSVEAKLLDARGAQVVQPMVSQWTAGANAEAAVELQQAVANPRKWSAEEPRSEEHTSELQSLRHLVCRLLLE